MRESAINELLSGVKDIINTIDAEYENANKDFAVKELLKIQIKHALEDMRSCLDYIANDIFQCMFNLNFQ